jgi:hypothetical protein
MPTNPFNQNEETSFEAGISVKKPVQTVTAQAQQQAKAFKDDFINQLYGPSDKNQTNDNNNSAANQQQAQQAPPKPKPHILGGNSDASDHAKYAMMQKHLERGDKKAADDAMHHMQYYYDSTIGTLEEQVKKARQLKQQEAQKKQQEEQEEQEKKRQEMEEKSQELPQATGKGRNRMGMPPQKKQKTPMSVQMGKNKAEMFRGSSG